MATLYTQQSNNIRKTWLLMSIFLAVVVVLGYVFSVIYDNRSILYFFIIFAILMNIISYWNSDKIALSLAKAHPATREKYFDLYNIVENLSITAGLPMPKVYVIEDSSPNAFATGRDKKHSVIAVTTGLLSILEKDELEGVVAHELSHIGNYDMLLSTVVVVLVGFISIASDMMMRGVLFGGRGGSSDSKDNNGIFAIVGIILAILSPLIATLIQLAISRKREYLADASGALLTRYPEGLAKALLKIKQYSRPMKAQSTAIAHLYISDPKGKTFGQKVSGLFATHPPIEDRVKALKNL